MKTDSGKSPMVVELESFIREKATVEMKTCDGQSYTGRLKWFDENAFCLWTSEGRYFTLLRASVIGYGIVKALS